ncbi:MAG: DivIVA domain-containing protein [Thermoleophilaceae bacterium]|nr:DivIVA domain-containing protein [Thermoleophilaceae bacterium]
MAADPNTDETSTQRFERPASASERLREVSFPLAMRGYDRHAVDHFVAELLAVVEDLESRQTREGVVQKALGELGEETAGILQRAHETADDITARSRGQADARLQRAEREAEILRHDANAYAEQVIVDTRALWDERQRLIEDIRQLADEVLGNADDAMDRLKLPEQLGTAEPVEPGAEAEEAPVELGAEPAPLGDEPAPPGEDPDPHGDDPQTIALAGDPEGEPLPDDHEPTQPFRLGSVADEPLDDPSHEESGHTVELEALPGGSEDPPERDRD